MPLPRNDFDIALGDISGELTDLDTAISALPATPVEADLPDIVQIVADLRTTTANLKAVVDSVAVVLKTTRINQ